jgi:alpha-tubulin suppressor-like RCC1 family protein
MIAAMARVGGLSVCVLAACYAPAPPPQPCSESGQCPTGQQCDLASRDCVAQLPPAARFTQIDAGAAFTCAIDDAGALFCWGKNGRGSLGIGDTIDRNRATQVTGDTGWRTVSAGELAACAIRDDTSMYCWGPGDDTGVISVIDGNTPVLVPGAGWAAVSVGYEGMCAIDTAGELYCKDDHMFGTPPVRFPTPGIVPVQVATSQHRRCVIAGDGALYCWGSNAQGQVGNAGRSDQPAPVRIGAAGQRWLAVATARETTCAIDSEQGLYCWGKCDNGQTGQGQQQDCLVPRRVGFDARFVAVDAGGDYTCAVRDDRAIVCFGENDSGQLGDHGDITDHQPSVMPVIGEWTAVTTGTDHACGLRDGDEAWCWGTNRDGELGTGRAGYVPAPTQIGGGTWQSVALARHSTCGTQTDGSAWCWGANARGGLGDRSTLARSVPVRVGRDADWVAISPGEYHTCGLRGPGQLWCWGSNLDGALGDGLAADTAEPERILSAIDDFAQVASGQRHTCALRGGQLSCWGQRFPDTPTTYGAGLAPWSSIAITASGAGPKGRGDACGVDASNDVYCWSDPTLFITDTAVGWQTFSAGFDHGCGLVGGSAFCLGENTNGQIGDGSTIAALAAQPVMGQHAWLAITAARQYTCGVTTDHELYCWGRADLVGIPGGADATAPTLVDANRWTTVVAGDVHACAIADDGTLWCWGEDDFGELGLGGGGSDHPLRVVPPE